jgi:leader peptidase (prepilin peptidase)/N-methyltransferase
MPVYAGVVLFGILGLLVGSFLNVCIYRVPLRRSVVWPASRCATCERPLAWYENVPVLSYAALGGRCRTCRAPISVAYPIVETVTAAVFVAHWLVFGPQPLLIIRTAFACALIVLFVIDLRHKILPDVITLPGIALGLACSLFDGVGIVSSLAGAAAGAGILWLLAELWLRLRGIEAMGFGDVKMLAMIGAVLGFDLVILTFILASLVGGVVGAVLIATRRGGMASEVPFGTMLAAAALVASLYGHDIVHWYLSTMGVLPS